AAKKFGIVGIKNDGNAGVVESPDWMFRQRCHGPRSQIAGDTHFQWNGFCGEMRYQRRIFDGANPVADAFRADFERFPNAPWTRHLAGMTGESQASIPRLAVKIGE